MAPTIARTARESVKRDTEADAREQGDDDPDLTARCPDGASLREPQPGWIGEPAGCARDNNTRESVG